MVKASNKIQITLHNSQMVKWYRACRNPHQSIKICVYDLLIKTKTSYFSSCNTMHRVYRCSWTCSANLISRHIDLHLRKKAHRNKVKNVKCLRSPTCNSRDFSKLMVLIRLRTSLIDCWASVPMLLWSLVVLLRQPLSNYMDLKK